LVSALALTTTLILLRFAVTDWWVRVMNSPRAWKALASRYVLYTLLWPTGCRVNYSLTSSGRFGLLPEFTPLTRELEVLQASGKEKTSAGVFLFFLPIGRRFAVTDWWQQRRASVRRLHTCCQPEAPHKWGLLFFSPSKASALPVLWLAALALTGEGEPWWLVNLCGNKPTRPECR